MAGTVNIARSLFDHCVFPQEPFTQREAWIWLIMEASWKPRTVRFSDYVIDLKRGQLASSVRFMASAFKWTPAKVQRCLKTLIRMKMIVIETDTGVSVITICNYDEYQNGEASSDTAPIHVRYTSDTNEKKDERRMKEGKIDSMQSDDLPEPSFDLGDSPPAKPKKTPKRAVAIPENWVPSDRNIDDARAKGMADDEIRQEGDRFRDYHLAKGTTFRDWDAGWRTWVGNWSRYRAGRGVAGGSSGGGGKPVGGLVGAFLRSEAGRGY